MQTEHLLIIAGVVALLAWKGYIPLPGVFSGGGGSKAADLGKKFLATVKQEAEDEAAGTIVEQMKTDMKAKMTAPFGAAAPDAPK